MSDPVTQIGPYAIGNIEAGLADTHEDSAVRESIRRDEELSSGAATGRTHEEVIQAARRSIGCG